MEVFVNGQFLPTSQATVSVQDRGLLYGDGLFETMRAEAGRPLWLERHLTRLGQSAAALNITLPHDFPWKIKIRELLQRNNLGHNLAAVKILITRGENATLGLPQTDQPTIIMYARKYTPPSNEEYRTGWPVISFPEPRLNFLGKTQEPELPFLSGGTTVRARSRRSGRLNSGSRRYGIRGCRHSNHLAGGRYVLYTSGCQCFGQCHGLRLAGNVRPPGNYFNGETSDNRYINLGSRCLGGELAHGIAAGIFVGRTVLGVKQRNRQIKYVTVVRGFLMPPAIAARHWPCLAPDKKTGRKSGGRHHNSAE